MYSSKLAQKLHNEFLYNKHTQKQIKYKTPETQQVLRKESKTIKWLKQCLPFQNLLL